MAMRSMRMGGKAAEINKAAASEPKSGHAKPAGGKAHAAGQERKADMRGAGLEDGQSGLTGAVGELRSQHPERYNDRGHTTAVPRICGTSR